MNKKTILTIVSIATLIIGLVIGQFTDVGNDLPAIGISALGFGGLIFATWKKSEKKGGALLAAIICMVISGMAAAFAEVSQDAYSKLIAAIVAVVALIAGILIPVISKAINKKE